MLEENGIEAMRACTLVLLSTGQYWKILSSQLRL
jgi:hypothetical protein